MIYGTCHFVSHAAAVRYYRAQDVLPVTVDLKIMEGEIFIGQPTLKPGQGLRVIDNGTRYAIEEIKP